MYISTSPLFRSLTNEEEKEFRTAARQNYVYNTPINPLWHPVYRDECEAMNFIRNNDERIFIEGAQKDHADMKRRVEETIAKIQQGRKTYAALPHPLEDPEGEDRRRPLM